MSARKRRTRGAVRAAFAGWFLFDERQLAWIAIAISGVLFFTLMSAG